MQAAALKDCAESRRSIYVTRVVLGHCTQVVGVVSAWADFCDQPVKGTDSYVFRKVPEKPLPP